MKIIHLIAGMAVAFLLTTATFAQSPLVAPAMVTVRGDEPYSPDFDVTYSYQIGRFEVLAEEYVAFLNAVAASDPYGLYHPAMSTDSNFGKLVRRYGSPGSYTYEYRSPEEPYSTVPVLYGTVSDSVGLYGYPIDYVSFHSAARFCNWLHNGATYGADTETGAYTLNGATSGALPPRNPDAKYWLPSRKEWFKAAYFNPYTWEWNQYPMDLVAGRHASYYDSAFPSDNSSYDRPVGKINNWRYANYRFPTGTDASTGAVYSWGAVFDFVGEYADYLVYEEGACVLRPVGSYYARILGLQLNPYGTFDMGGNVAEWIEDGTLRGGSAYDNELAMDQQQNAYDWDGPPQGGTGGFRVASLAGQHTFYVTNGYIDVDLPGEIIAPFGVYIYKPDHQIGSRYDADNFVLDDNRLTCGIRCAYTAQNLHGFGRGFVNWARWVGGRFPDGTTSELEQDGQIGQGFRTVTNYWSVFSHDFNYRDGLPASGRYQFNWGEYWKTNRLNNYYITLKTVPAPEPSPIENTALGTNGFSVSWLNKHAYFKVQRRTSLTEGNWETIRTFDVREPTRTYKSVPWDQAPQTFIDPAPPAGRAYYRIKVD